MMQPHSRREGEEEKKAHEKSPGTCLTQRGGCLACVQKEKGKESFGKKGWVGMGVLPMNGPKAVQQHSVSEVLNPFFWGGWGLDRDSLYEPPLPHLLPFVVEWVRNPLVTHSDRLRDPPVGNLCIFLLCEQRLWPFFFFLTPVRKKDVAALSLTQPPPTPLQVVSLPPSVCSILRGMLFPVPEEGREGGRGREEEWLFSFWCFVCQFWGEGGGKKEEPLGMK